MCRPQDISLVIRPVPWFLNIAFGLASIINKVVSIQVRSGHKQLAIRLFLHWLLCFRHDLLCHLMTLGESQHCIYCKSLWELQAGVENMVMSGRVRLIFTPLLDTLPIIGAIQVRTFKRFPPAQIWKPMASPTKMFDCKTAASR